MRSLLAIRQLLALCAIFQTLLAAHLTLSIRQGTALANPATLPSSTRATLFRRGNTLTAPITRYNGFDFKHITPGSYLLTIQCRDYIFEPLRVDVTATGEADVSSGLQQETVEVFQTFWGNEWSNKGEKRGGGVWDKVKDERIIVEVTPVAVKNYYEERVGFDPISFLKNPMILMALFSLVLIIGMPYLTENMDEETRKEFEEIQQSNPLTGGKALQSDTAQAIQNFDLAGWMAGQSKTKK